MDRAKAVCVSKAKQRNSFIFPIGRHVFSHLQEIRAPPHVMVTWENKCSHSGHPHPTPFFFPQLLLLGVTLYGMEYHFVLLGVVVSCPACVPSQFLVHSQPTHWQESLQAEKASTLCKHYSAIAKTPLCYQHCFQHRSKPAPY